MKTRRHRLTAIMMGLGVLRRVSNQKPRGAETVISGRAPGEPFAGVTEVPGIEGLTRRFKHDAGKSPRKSPGAGCRAATAGPAVLMAEVAQLGEPEPGKELCP